MKNSRKINETETENQLTFSAQQISLRYGSEHAIAMFSRINRPGSVVLNF